MTAPESLDVIELEALAFDSVIGAYPSERGGSQRMHLDVSLALDTRGASSGDLTKTVDYARLIGELRFLLHSCRFLLLETAAEALCRYILAPPTVCQQRAQIEWASVRLRKPSACATLRVQRRREEYTYVQEQKPFGLVDVLYEHDAFGIYRLRVAPGRSIVTHEHRLMEEHEMVLGDGLRLQHQPIAAGSVIDWPKLFPHRYDNPGATEQTVLCVDRPRFVQSDEVEVAEPAAGLVMPPLQNFYPAEHASAYA